MSFEELMAHAQDLQYLAAKHAIDHREEEPEYARNGVDGYYAQVIPPLFEPYSKIQDPKVYDPLIGDLRTVMAGLSNGQANTDALNSNEVYPANPTLAKITTAGDMMKGWTGEAGMAFKAKFLDPFPMYSRNQYILTAVLKAGLDAHKAMWTSARHDIDMIAEGTIHAFDNAGCTNKNDWNVGFTILSSLAAVTAAFLPVAGTAALTATIIAAASQTAAVLPPDIPDAPKDAGGTGEGVTALQIINTMKDGIGKLTSVIQKTEAKITAGLTTLTGGVNPTLFEAPRPAIADTPPGSVTGDKGLGGHE
jgi:hypothetical protein